MTELAELRDSAPSPTKPTIERKFLSLTISSAQPLPPVQSLPHFGRAPLRALLNREQIVPGHDEHRAVGRNHSGVHRTAHVHLSQHFLLAPVLEDRDVAILVAQVYLAIDDQWRAPHCRKHVVLPDLLAGLQIDAVEETTEVRVIDEAVLDRRS